MNGFSKSIIAVCVSAFHCALFSGTILTVKILYTVDHTYLETSLFFRLFNLDIFLNWVPQYPRINPPDGRDGCNSPVSEPVLSIGVI